MILVPDICGFNYVTGNVLTTRPTGGFGTTLTPGNNTYPAYAQILAGTSVLHDCYRIIVNINSITANAAAKDAIVTIGIDTQGGSAYVDWIPNLLGSCATGWGSGACGHTYDFPLFVPVGSSLAAKASVNNATVGTANIAVWLFGSPSNPAYFKAGQGVQAIGITAASSTGTAVTSGTTNEGAWTSLGTTSRACFAWQLGMGINNASMSALSYNADLGYGDGTNNTLIISDVSYMSGSAETFSMKQQQLTYCDVPNGGTVYGRLQCSGTADTGINMAAYGVY